jgi:hypothetical protein
MLNKLLITKGIMSQEKKEETIYESNESVKNSIPEEKSEIINKGIQLDVSYTKGLEGAIEQIRLFEENSKKVMDIIDVVSFSSHIENLKKFEESTIRTMNVMESSARFNIIDQKTLKYLNELKDIYYELNQEIVDIPNVSVVSQGALITDIDSKMEGAIKAQNAYIESLERELIKKEEEIRQLKAIIEEKKKKDDFVA